MELRLPDQQRSSGVLPSGAILSATLIPSVLSESLRCFGVEVAINGRLGHSGVWSFGVGGLWANSFSASHLRVGQRAVALWFPLRRYMPTDFLLHRERFHLQIPGERAPLSRCRHSFFFKCLENRESVKTETSEDTSRKG